MLSYDKVFEQHRRDGRALLYWAATIEAGVAWDETSQGIYENIRQGMMDCDDAGRRLWLTELGKAKVESMVIKDRH